jgi:hypothetical protein
MVVHNFNAVSVSVAPHKADTPLVVDTYAVLPVRVTAERLQPIGGRSFQIFEFGSGLNHSQFSARYSLDIAEPSAVMAQADLFGFLAAKRLYHRLLYRASCNVEQYRAKRAGQAPGLRRRSLPWFCSRQAKGKLKACPTTDYHV